MKFLLKIVQGPNAGAEIALVEGVRVTLGSADSCDIVLADPTLAAEACAIEASADSVLLSVPGSEPERLAPLQVRTFGSTALAVGPAGSPWGPLNWEAPAPAAPAEEDSGDSRSGGAGSPGKAEKPAPEAAPAPESGRPGKTPARRGRRLGCLILLLLLLLAAWLLTRRWEKPSTPESAPEAAPAARSTGLAVLAEKFGLSVVETNGTVRVRGDFATRAERLDAAAALYKELPTVALDLADAETLRSATKALLDAATDGAISVVDVTNRVAVLAGRSPDPAAFRATLEALREDVPRLSGVDTAKVTLDSPVAPSPASAPETPAAPVRRARPAAPRAPRLPLACILLQPYPCLVLQDGQRLVEGGEVGGYKISKITFDRISFRNEQGEEFEWTP